MINPLDIAARAKRQQPLTPAERAFLRSVGGLWQAALAAAIVAVLQAALHGERPLTFGDLARIGAIAGATALVMGVSKLVSAQGDTQLGQVLDDAAQMAAGRLQQQFMPPGASPTPQRFYSGVASRPIAARLAGQPGGQTASGSFPPMMPDSPRSRADLLRQAGGTPMTDQTTKPTPAITPDYEVTWKPRGLMADNGDGEPAPSQTVTPTADDLERAGDGPPTLQAPIVRPPAPPTPQQEASADWLTKP